MARSKSIEPGRTGRRLQARRSKSDSSIPKKRKRLTQCGSPPSGNPEGSWPKILPTPLKSPADENDYRIIQLSNGLKAILISYNPSCAYKEGEPKKIQTNRKCLAKNIVNFNANIVGVEVKDTPKDARPTSSSSQIRPKPDVRPKSSGKTPEDCDCYYCRTWIVVNVGTGYIDDPKELPGCAHLVEHLIITGGSAKYPNCRFQEFAREHDYSVYTHASTRTSNVNYSLGIAHRDVDLPNVLDTFVNLFISPTFYVKDIKTEREAVDSEYLDKKHSELKNIFRMYQLFLKTDHSAANFPTGSKETLVAPDGNDETLRKMLLKYFEKYYTAGNITVAISAPETLDVIQELVVKYFTQIPARTDKIERPGNCLASDPVKFKRFYRVKSKIDWNTLFVAWDLPLSMADNYETKPLVYLAKLIETEAPGGLSFYFKEKNWISGIRCRAPAVGLNTFYSSAKFSIAFDLRKTGTEIVFKILEALHSYLKFLLKVEPQEWYFNEIRWIESLDFHFYSGYTAKARNLQCYPPEDCLIGERLVTKWDPCAITSCLALLIPGDANVMIVSKSVEKCNFLEPFFGIAYGVMEDEHYQTWVKKWAKIKPFKEFKFPCPNKFITTNFCAIAPNRKHRKNQFYEYIEVVMNNKLGFVNMNYEIDQADYWIAIKTALPLYTTENNMMLYLWVRLLKRILRPILYGVTEDVLTSYDIYASYNGIHFMVDGFSQHLNTIVLEIFQQIENLPCSVTSEMFEAEKSQVLEWYSNALDAPDELASLLKYTICYENADTYWPKKYKTLVAMTFEDFQRFWTEFNERLFISVTADGDVSRDNSMKMANSISKMMKYEPFLRCFELGREPPAPTVNELPLGDSILRVRSKNPKSNKSYIGCFYQIKVRSYYERELLFFLEESMRYPAKKELRQKQDLGYHVGVHSFGSSICIFVNSHSHKFNGTHVKDEIDNFVKEFYEKELKKLTDAELPWFMAYYKIKVKQILEFYEKYLLPGPTSEMRKLTIQVVGKADEEFSQEYVQDLAHQCRGNRKLKKIKKSDISITVLAPDGDEEESTRTPDSPQYIRNIMDFKSQLYAFPPYSYYSYYD